MKASESSNTGGKIMDDETPVIHVKSCDTPPPFPVTEQEDNDTVLRKTFAGLYVLGFALFLGIWADLLLRTRPYGLNVPLWVCALAACIWILARLQDRRLSPAQHGLLAAACVFAAMLAWRDANILRGLDLVAAAIALGLASVPETLLGAPVSRAGFIQYATGGAVVALQGIGGGPELVAKDIRWSAIPAKGTAGHFKAAGLGMLLAVPVLLVFGVLLSRADAAFEAMVTGLFRFSPETIVQHLLVFFFGTWLSAGLLRLMAPLFKPLLPEEFLGAPKGSLNTLTVCIPLALTNLLFLSFIAVQTQELFGGHALVHDPQGPTYAEYARRGFMELAMVVSLALPLLMLSDWSLRDAPKGERRVFRGLSAATLLMLLVISASALHRMRMYLETYGLTRLRFYTTALILWLIVLTVWFAVTILCERRQHFMFGALATGLTAILALNVINPDWCIAGVNLERAADPKSAQKGVKIDYDYLVTLSADASAAFPPASDAKSGPGVTETENATKWYFRKLPEPSTDLRSWNWSRSRAQYLKARILEGASPTRPGAK